MQCIRRVKYVYEIVVAAFLSLLMVSCGSPEQETLTKNEVDAISRFFSVYFDPEEPPYSQGLPVVLPSATAMSRLLRKELEDAICFESISVEDWKERLIEQNKTSLLISDYSGVRVPYEVMELEDVRQFSDGSVDWTQFHLDYSQADRFLLVSRPLITEDGDIALLAYFLGCPLCGEAGVVLLKSSVENRWVVVDHCLVLRS